MRTLKVEQLVKKYRGRPVVAASFQVKQGEIVGLLGPNGAGKTTSFYMTVGLIKPNEGRVLLDQEDITSDPMYKGPRKALVISRKKHPYFESYRSKRTSSCPSDDGESLF